MVGAGAAGLVAARELLRAGHSVVVFESRRELGGVWIYRDAQRQEPAEPSDPRSPLYESLRTNLPADLMRFRDFQFASAARFPRHEAVLAYLQRFAEDHDLCRHIRFGTTVECLRLSCSPAGEPRWEIIHRRRGAAASATRFDAVAVCNGHYARPRWPEVPGLDSDAANVIHSRDYRRPDGFAGCRVLIVGSGASALDLALELARTAAAVEVALRPAARRQGPFVRLAADDDAADPIASPPTLRLRHELVEIAAGQARFADGGSGGPYDRVVVCTGYLYDFPFLAPEIETRLGSDPKRSGPSGLLLDVALPGAPTLGFIGLPFKIVPFPLFELQSRWFARSLGAPFTTGHAAMLRWRSFRRRARRDLGLGAAHALEYGAMQFAYNDYLAALCNQRPLPEDFRDLYRRVTRQRAIFPTDYRDRPLRRATDRAR